LWRCAGPHEEKKPKSTFYIVLSLINLDLITIFSTLFKIFVYLTNIIIILLFPIAAICRSTRRKEVIIYDLLSFECYLHCIRKSGINHLFLYFITKVLYLKLYILANIIIVLLFPITAICRSENRGNWEKKNNGALIWLINLFLFLYNNFFLY
jgi:hypothetical protein